MKTQAMMLMSTVLLCAACDQPPPPAQPPTPKTDEPYTGIYQDQIKVLEKAKQTGGALERTEAERQQEIESATQ